MIATRYYTTTCRVQRLIAEIAYRTSYVIDLVSYNADHIISFDKHVIIFIIIIIVITIPQPTESDCKYDRDNVASL